MNLIAPSLFLLQFIFYNISFRRLFLKVLQCHNNLSPLFSLKLGLREREKERERKERRIGERKEERKRKGNA